MRFCMISTFYPPANFGGDGVFVHRLAHALAQRGHEVEVVHEPNAYDALGGPSEGAAAPEVPGVRRRPLPRGARGRAGLLLGHQLGRPVLRARRLRRLLEDGGFDVLHFHNVSLLGGPGVLRYGSALKLCTLHDYWFVCAMHVLWRFDREACTRRTCIRCTLAGRRPPQAWRYAGSVRRAAREVDAFLTGSRLAARLHAANGFPAPIRVLPLFAKAPAADAGPAPHPRPYFLYVGRLEKLKGVQVLLRVLARAPAADLLIVGRGSYEGELRRQARGLAGVHFLGWVGGERLAALYRGALAAVAPSLSYETFGLVPAEAFATGTPAVVPAGTALEEVVQEGGGIVYRSERELEAALVALASDPELGRRLGQEGRGIYRRRYTEEAHLEAYLDLVRELQGRGGEAA